MNDFDLNTSVDQLDRKTDIYPLIQIRCESIVNLLENKYDGAYSTYQAYDFVRMMIEITILMLNTTTGIVNNRTMSIIDNI
jgi:hypothetical protein